MAKFLGRKPISVGATDIVKVDVTDDLDAAESLVDPPIVTEQVTSDLMPSNCQINTTTQEILGRTVAVGKAVLFTVSGQLVANSPYLLLITATSDSDPVRTLKWELELFAV